MNVHADGAAKTTGSMVSGAPASRPRWVARASPWTRAHAIANEQTASSFMFESNRNPQYPAGYDYGISRNGVMLAAAIGVSVDPAAMVLAVWDAVRSLWNWRLP